MQLKLKHLNNCFIQFKLLLPSLKIMYRDSRNQRFSFLSEQMVGSNGICVEQIPSGGLMTEHEYDHIQKIKGDHAA